MVLLHILLKKNTYCVSSWTVSYATSNNYNRGDDKKKSYRNTSSLRQIASSSRHPHRFALLHRLYSANLEKMALAGFRCCSITPPFETFLSFLFSVAGWWRIIEDCFDTIMSLFTNDRFMLVEIT